MKDNRTWVAASDAGRAKYCPKTLEFKYKKVKPTQRAMQARKSGDRAHEQFNRQAQDQRCYVASYAFGADHPKTQYLRDYRDKHLKASRVGRLFITCYYIASPALVVVARKSTLVSSTLLFVVEKFIQHIKGINR